MTGLPVAGGICHYSGDPTPRPRYFKYSFEQDYDDDWQNKLVDKWYVGRDFEEDWYDWEKTSIGRWYGWKSEAAENKHVRKHFQDD